MSNPVRRSPRFCCEKLMRIKTLLSLNYAKDPQFMRFGLFVFSWNRPVQAIPQSASDGSRSWYNPVFVPSMQNAIRYATRNYIRKPDQ